MSQWVSEFCFLSLTRKSLSRLSWKGCSWAFNKFSISSHLWFQLEEQHTVCHVGDHVVEVWRPCVRRRSIPWLWASPHPRRLPPLWKPGKLSSLEISIEEKAQELLFLSNLPWCDSLSNISRNLLKTNEGFTFINEGASRGTQVVNHVHPHLTRESIMGGGVWSIHTSFLLPFNAIALSQILPCTRPLSTVWTEHQCGVYFLADRCCKHSHCQ